MKISPIVLTLMKKVKFAIKNGLILCLEADSDVEFNDEPVLPLRKKSRQTTLKEYFC